MGACPGRWACATYVGQDVVLDEGQARPTFAPCRVLADSVPSAVLVETAAAPPHRRP